jgi:hypothetical protein
MLLGGIPHLRLSDALLLPPFLLLLPTVTVNISNIAPLPQRLSQNGSNIVVNGKQAMLFRPVIHLFGRKNRTLNGEVSRHLLYCTCFRTKIT